MKVYSHIFGVLYSTNIHFTQDIVNHMQKEKKIKMKKNKIKLKIIKRANTIKVINKDT